MHRRVNAELHGFQVFRTLGDDDDISTVLAFQRLAQSSSRHQPVVDDEPMIIDQQDVDARGDVAVLEAIVHEDDVDVLLYDSLVHQLLNTMTAVLVNGYSDVG